MAQKSFKPCSLTNDLEAAVNIGRIKNIPTQFRLLLHLPAKLPQKGYYITYIIRELASHLEGLAFLEHAERGGGCREGQMEGSWWQLVPTRGLTYTPPSSARWG